MKTVLALISDPDNSDHLIRYVIMISEKIQAKLILVYLQTYNAHPPPALSAGISGAYGYSLDFDLEEEKKRARELLKNNFARVTGPKTPAIPVHLDAEFGSPKNMINEYLEKNDQLMVALEGSMGGSLLSPHSSVMDVVRNVKCPVWVIPPEVDPSILSPVVYATNYDEADIPTLKRIKNIFAGLDPEITLLHVADQLDFDEKIRKEGFKEFVTRELHPQKMSFELIEGQKDSLGETICAYAHKAGARLIVLLKEERGFLEKLVSGSATRKVIHESELPVLIFHKK